MENYIQVFNAMEKGKFTSKDFIKAYEILTDGDSFKKSTFYNFMSRVKLGGFMSSSPRSLNKTLPKRGEPRVDYEKHEDVPEEAYWMFRGSFAQVEHKLSLMVSVMKKNPAHKISMTQEQFDKWKEEYLALKDSHDSALIEIETLKEEKKNLPTPPQEEPLTEIDWSFLE